MSKKLKMVTAGDENIINQLIIIANKDNYNLAYKTEDNSQITVTNDSRYRPLRISELKKLLESRDWNITERKYISNPDNTLNDILKLKIGVSSGPIDIINSTTDTDSSGTVTGVAVSTRVVPSPQLKEQFINTYKNILGSMTGNEIYIYNSSRNIVDFINNSIVINAIKYDSDSYTNILNLDDLVNNSAHSGISSKVDLTIQYSKGSRIINHDTAFEAFRFGDDNEIESNNFIEDINSDVVLEYFNNIIRVIPSSDDVNECIIRNCTITYGNID